MRVRTSFRESVRKSPIPLQRPATIVHTSGSTGVPRAMLHSCGNHYYNALGSNANLPLTVGDRWLLDLPLHPRRSSGLSSSTTTWSRRWWCRSRTWSTASGEVAFVRHRGPNSGAAALEAWLQRTLPRYMVPDRFLGWPETDRDSFKIDRARFRRLARKTRAMTSPNRRES